MLTTVNTENNKAKEFNSERHSLYIKDVRERKVLVDGDKKLYDIIPSHKEYRFFVGVFFELKRGLHDVFNQLHNASKYDRLELFINSHGGLIFEGKQFYNIIQRKFKNRTTAYLDNLGYSMGALLFCMADKRVAYEYSDFMFHNYWGGVHGKGGEIKAKVEHSSRVLEKFFHDIIVKQGFLTEKEFEQMLVGQDYWMDTKELCKRGIATHVIIDEEEITAKEYLKILKEQKKKKKSKKK
ncbi:ATP-dependent Clp protease proteolytic subunit [hydrothermal vent metagenome]|uniref:ATP-dependent Clp protease proteolytic subunit n=1 Tax=hydrothermal vent metagenome TaxID=652676 RepID=A0A1W1BRH1_9ZZZZ